MVTKIGVTLLFWSFPHIWGSCSHKNFPKIQIVDKYFWAVVHEGVAAAMNRYNAEPASEPDAAAGAGS